MIQKFIIGVQYALKDMIIRRKDCILLQYVHNFVSNLFGEISVRASVGAGPCACPNSSDSCACSDSRAMLLNDAGRMIESVWHEIPEYYPGFSVHECVVMPDHFHGIVEIEGVYRTIPQKECVIDSNTKSLPDIVHRFKTLTTKRYTDGVKYNGWERFEKRLCHRNYYEHIIRNEEGYYRISEYIKNNPDNWKGKVVKIFN